jgi:phosphoribosyl-AMP cyclohydrolase
MVMAKFDLSGVVRVGRRFVRGGRACRARSIQGLAKRCGGGARRLRLNRFDKTSATPKTKHERWTSNHEENVKPQFAPDFEKAGGLITAVTVDAEDGEVLMVAYMNEEAFLLTLETGRVHYFSRSRGKLWKKGEQSGNMQELVEMRVDCDLDAVVVRVKQKGPACHEGYRSCFFRSVESDGKLGVRGERLMTAEEMYGVKS